MPSEALRQPCPVRTQVPELIVEDIYQNRDLAIAHGDDCSARLNTIIDWYKNYRSSAPLVK